MLTYNHQRCGSTPAEHCECDECKLFRDTADDVTLNHGGPEPMRDYDYELAFNAVALPAAQSVANSDGGAPPKMQPMPSYEYVF